jgi:hypothetical protein
MLDESIKVPITWISLSERGWPEASHYRTEFENPRKVQRRPPTIPLNPQIALHAIPPPTMAEPKQSVQCVRILDAYLLVRLTDSVAVRQEEDRHRYVH